MRRGLHVAYDLHGQYSTDIFTDESVSIIDKHNTSKPLFLYLAHAAVHSGNAYNPLPSYDKDVRSFKHIKNYSRMRFAGIPTEKLNFKHNNYNLIREFIYYCS